MAVVQCGSVTYGCLLGHPVDVSIRQLLGQVWSSGGRSELKIEFAIPLHIVNIYKQASG